MKEVNKLHQEKSVDFLRQVLFEMNAMVENKLKGIKTFMPVLLTIITSVLAFLLVTDIAVTEESKFVLFWALAALLLAFSVLIVSFFGKNFYKSAKKAKNRKNIQFEPHVFLSYCYLSDCEFIEAIKLFAKRELTDKEIMSVNFLKQKVNEYVYRKTLSNIALAIVEIGTIVLIITAVVAPFVL